MDAQFWDEMYGSREQFFGGNPNGVLVTEVADLPPGRALDVGCGEGADALWLARLGWQVTAVDISQIALQRGAAKDFTGRVSWEQADLTITAPPAGAFDLVSAQYMAFPRESGPASLRGLLAAVAPGGTLLVAGHDLSDRPPDHDPKFSPGDFFHEPGEIATLLDDAWTVLINETRPRATPPPSGTHHTHDTVLRAQRLR